jgi:predicted transcriptional regulator
MSATATSLKLPSDLKTRIERLARRAGESPHAYMLRLLEERVDAAERFEKFIVEAREADGRMEQSGLGYAAEDVYAYLEARVAGRRKGRPKPVAWRK